MLLRRLLFLGLALSCWLLPQMQLEAQINGGKERAFVEVSEARIPAVGTRYIRPTAYRTFSLNLSGLSSILAVAPMENTAVGINSATHLDLPMPDGTFKRFRIVESPIMDAALSARFPEIETYAGVDVEDPGTYLRFDLTPQGFHAMITSPKFSTVFIDPYSFGGDIRNYIVYHKRDFVPLGSKTMVCDVQGNAVDIDGVRPNTPTNNWRFGDCRLRTYRLALSATGEYSTFHGGTVALAQAAQITTMNRVNSILEREFAARLIIVGNNNLLIYTNTATDPYTNGDTNAMINENQTNTTTVIGSANYDIGHVFGTDSGGLAGLGVVCNTANKARGVTGSSAPIGDPFDVDYVAHEMGHQFGANHTQNNNCNRNAATAMETGSGSTIMSYAGICAPNVQNAVHDNYHSISLQEITTFVTSAGHTCPVTTNLANTAPVLTAPSGSTNFSIPISTPFFLTAAATDPDANTLSYSWEQTNNQVSTQAPVATATVGPNFRAFSPSTSPTRYFPRLQDLASGAATIWEVLPSVSRAMRFQVTVRDNAAGGGCTDEATVSVTTVAAAGPFVVTAPTATGITWAGTTNQTVTWNVAGTTAAPISCANVDIMLSTDGGLTYPIVLATNTPNDGSQVIIAPNLSTTTARVQIVCSNNIFFDISNNNFTITPATNDYTITATPASVSVCPPANGVYNISVGSIGGFSNNVTLTTTGLAAGLTATFSPSTVVPGNTSTLTLSGTNNVPAGTYSFNIVANSTTGTKTIAATLVIAAGAPATVSLTAPTNGATNVATQANFSWTASAGVGIVYQIDIATDAAFTNIVATASNLTVTNFTPTAPLANNTAHFWRVRASNSCALGSFSSTFSFTTSNITCYTFNSTNVPRTISDVGINTTTSTLTIPSIAGTITDVNVISLAGTHSYIQDLVVRLASPAATSVTLFQRACNNQTDFDIKFDDAAASATLPCPLTGGGTFRPRTVLSAFNGQVATGVWTLSITDSADVDGGQLNAWGIEVCIAAPTCNVVAAAAITSNYNGAQLSCNGASNAVAVATASSGTAPYSFAWSPSGRTTSTATGLSAGVHTVTVTDAAACTAIASVTVVAPSVLTGLANGTNATCNGLCNGSALAAASGGTSPYSFAWSNGRTTATNTGLCAGTYNVTMSDINGCNVSRSVTITQPSVFTTAASSTNATCNTLCNGTALATSAGGTGAVSFAWSNGSLTATNSALCAGTHTVTATDANSCTATANVVITQPTALTAVATNTNNLCNGSCTAVATISATGGVAPYAFAWSNGQTTSSATGLCAGGYSVTTTDANGCTIVRTLTVTQPTALTAVATNTNNLCNGSCTAVATISATGGVAPYAFAWSNGQTTSSATGLCAGGYSVTTTDANGCTIVRTLTVTQPTALTAVATNTNNLCNGSCTAVATISATGGVAPYAFAWSNGQTTSNATGLCAGGYSVTTTDANGCIIVRTLTVTQPTVITANATATSTTCALNDGTATVTTTGGTAPYSFLWSNTRTTANITGLTAAVYTVSITDANGCQTTRVATVGNGCTVSPCAISVTASSTNATCNALCNGTAVATSIGGTGAVSFAWSNGSLTATTSALCAGTHTVTATDANSCTATANVVITQPTALTAVATNTNNFCNGSCTAVATISATGGVAPYAFAWSNGQTTSNATGLCAGGYSVTTTDANGCTIVRTFTVTQPTVITANATATSTTCALNDGTATVTTTGGTAPYSFLWSNTRTTANITGLTAAVYTVSITDANGCQTTRVATVGNGCTVSPCAISVTASSTNATCNALCNGTAVATSAGGTGAVSFAWSNGSLTATTSALCAGTHTVTATDANSCTATANVVITQPTVLTAVATNTNNLCNGSCTAVATISATGGVAPYAFAWSNGQTTSNATGLCAGGYSVTTTDANGCTIVRTLTVTQPTALTAVVTNTNNLCNSSCTAVATISATGGVAPYAFAWSNGQTTSSATGLCAGGYSVTTTDANGCTIVRTLTVTQPTVITANATATSTTCALNDGTATVTTTGGTAPYSFLWSNTRTTTNITGLTAAVYTVSITDANGCQTTRVATVGNGCTVSPCAISVTASSTNATCNALCNGTAVATSAGGTGAVSFAWSNGSLTATTSALCAGTHTVTATDANSCTATANVVITQPTALTAVATNTNNLCNGSCTAVATISATGGVAPYAFAWSNGQTTSNATGLCAGGYSVTTTDANGCTIVRTLTVTQPTVITANATATSTTCALNDGTATVTTTGGTAPYSFLWSNTRTTANITGLTAAVYTVSITDANGCQTTRVATVGNGCTVSPCAISVTASSTNATCNALCNGTAVATSIGGTGAVSFAWSNGSLTATTSALCAGTHTVTATDANSCTATANVVITQPTALTAVATNTNNLCNGSCTAVATISATGGVAPYAFAWSNGQTTSSATGLCAGGYSVTTTDANGCIIVRTLTVTQPTVITANATATSTTCALNDGTATVTTTGGTAPYSFLWSNTRTTANITGLTAAVYTVSITDANGCQTTRVATVGNGCTVSPCAISVTASSTNATCNALCNGTAVATSIGGTGAVSFAWSNGSLTATTSALCAGTYTVTATDANSCTATANVVITQPTALTAVATNTNNLCNGSCTAVATISATGGVAPYAFAWSNGQTTSSATGLCAGGYSVTTTDANGCTIVRTLTVTQPTVLTANTTATSTTCALNDGTATVTTTGGTAPYSFLWSNTRTTANITGLTAAVYTVSITDANGCQTTRVATVGNGCTVSPCAISVTASSTNATCNALCNGTAVATSTSGTGAVSFAWSNGSLTATTSALCAGTHTVTATDANSCTATANVVITQPTALTAVVTNTNNLCNGSCTAVATISATGGVAPYAFAWSNGQTTSSATGLCAGGYSVTTTDANGCTIVRTLTVTQPTVLTANTTATSTTCALNDGTATVTTTGGTAPYSFLWSNTRTTANITGLTAAVYTVSITDANGCQTTRVATVGNGCTVSPCAISVTASSTNATCNALCNGTAVATSTGGTGAVSFTWSNGSLTATTSALCAGTHTVTATDANSCTATANVVITQPIALTAVATNTNNLCNGSCTAVATISATGGVAPYAFAWSNGQTTSNATGLCAGGYSVTTTDANGCRIVRTLTVSQPTVLTANTTATSTTCALNDGTAAVTTTGGTAPYSFLWSNTRTTANITGLTAAIYTVSITDANGCQTTRVVTVGNGCPCNIVATASVTNPSCTNFCNGEIQTVVSGLNGAATYLWNNGQTTANLSGLCANTYVVTITDALGCTQRLSNLVLLNPTPLNAVINTSNASCNGNDGFASVSASNGAGGYTYLWQPNGTTTAAVSGVNAGTYNIVVTDANGCSISRTAIIGLTNTLSVTNPIVTQTPNCFGAATGAAFVAAAGANNIGYLWDNGETTSSAVALTGGVHTVTISSAGGCTQVRTVTIAQPAQIQITLVGTQQNCVANSGLISATPTNTIGAPFSFVWNTGATTNVISGLGTGTYTVSVSNASGCTVVSATNISIASPFGLSSTHVLPTCNTGGSIDLTVSPLGNYTFLWNNGATSEDVQNLSGGIFQVQVRDASGCVQTLRDTLPSALPLQVSFSVTLPTQPFVGDGAISATANNGTAPYSYVWNTGSTSNALLGISSGTYIVTATDAAGCSVVDTIIVHSLTSVDAPAMISQGLSISPNPAQDYFDIRLQAPISGAFMVRIYDALGRVIYESYEETTALNLPISVSELPSATYFVQIRTKSQGETTRKLVIIR